MRIKRIKKPATFEPPGMDGVQITLDPTGAYKRLPSQTMWDSLGLIPFFVQRASQEVPEGSAKEVMDKMDDVYGFGLGQYNMLDQEEGSHIDNEGVYYYPNDPDLAPIVKFELEHTTVYVYPYALVATDDAQEQIMRRFD